MWKPWILVALGTIIISHVSAQANQTTSIIEAPTQSSYNSNFLDINPVCKGDIEKVCGLPAKLNTKVIANKKGTFMGTGDEKADLINAMKSAIGQLATPLPGNFNSLCTNVVANVNQDIQGTTMDGVDGILASWNLPNEVSNFLANIKFSEDVVYQTYRFALQTGETKLSEFIASGKNNG